MSVGLKGLFRFKKTETVHQALSSSIILAQCFGLMPIGEVTNSDYRKLKFNYASMRFAYTMVYMVLQFANMTLYIASISENGVYFGNFVTLMFFGCSLLTCWFFIALAKQWPDLMKFWCEIDEKLRVPYGFPKGLHNKLRLITTTVIAAAIIEHTIFVAHAVTASGSAKSRNIIEAVDTFFQAIYSHVFKYLPYNLILGCLVEAIHLLCTFTWNYMDLFIMLISSAVTARFGQVKESVEKAVENSIDDASHWMEIRNNYNRLSLLCKMLDKALANIILLSFANNLFVVLVQLLHTLENHDGDQVISRLYFTYSFGFLIIRTFFVALLASKVHSESIEPVYILNKLPSELYNVEVDRMMMQIRMDPISLSGRGFFKVKKSLILSIAGAIVSYELIFIQFNRL